MASYKEKASVFRQEFVKVLKKHQALLAMTERLSEVLETEEDVEQLRTNSYVVFLDALCADMKKLRKELHDGPDTQTRGDRAN